MPASVGSVRADEVILVNSFGQPIGSRSKALVHDEATPLHLAFSLFLFDYAGRTLVQRRAAHKRTWGGVWSNACCGHPLPGESVSEAVERRLSEELGIEGLEPVLVLPHFRYEASWQGIRENEFCPVFVARCQVEPLPNPEEVEGVAWIEWSHFAQAAQNPAGTPFERYSPWSLLEATQLAASPFFNRFLNPQEEKSA